MRHRLLKSLRIAVTAISLFVCGLPIVLWVRSCYHHEILSRYFYTLRIGGHSYDGLATLLIGQDTPRRNESRGWKLVALPRAYIEWRFYPDDKWLFTQHMNRGVPFRVIRAPYWFYVTISATIAALPWIKWRFSLSTLLIVLTLFALFFGAIAMSL